MKRVLAIHGHSQCAQSLRYKLSAIEEACQDTVEIVYVDAPHTLLAVDLPGAVLPQASAVTISGQPARAWWRFLYTMRDVDAVHKSFEYIRRVLEEQGPFDGILGFSQGASFAAMIVAHMENQDMPGCLLRGVNHPQFQFAILISGFFAPCDVVALPNVPIRTPSLHVFGIHDIMVSPENMARLTTYFDAPRVEVHAGGHFIPRTQAWTRFIAAYLKSTAEPSFTGAPGSHYGVVAPPIRSPTLKVCREEFFSIRKSTEGLDGRVRPYTATPAEIAGMA